MSEGLKLTKIETKDGGDIFLAIAKALARKKVDDKATKANPAIPAVSNKEG